ncbi:alkanesulfonate monooxygenase SsuD/methylene tetrahydromethanopterin reductase-like flavin-dependent oxidoreductase (luciferase family) [Pseudonocardia eucalypti]|nr:alkanesulfonate monooxygenase SsuD/methylene tetrahydromethanopterin reductase-like flavin-dependent oxidoreductase (luciferase family) [Pseudonocardia eucalypti]
MSNTLVDGQDFKLGLFSPNCSGGLAVTAIPERWSASWADNLRLAQLADQVGIDFILPIARWIGYGGETNFHEGVLEPIPWASGLLASTRRVVVFATVHTAFNHPVVSAKQLATVDHVGGGRAGVNVVAGWNEPEYRAMGVELPEAHDDRYARAQEWFDHLRALWTTEGRGDREGRFFTLRGVESMPKPVQGVLPVLNAGSSPQGRDFAARNANFVFTIIGDADEGAKVVAQLTEAARTRYQRAVGVMSPAHVVCRPTRAEAREYLHYYAEENADWEAVDNLMRLQGLHAQSFTKEMLAGFRSRFAAGHGTCPLIGTPDDVADEIERYAKAGLAGMTLSFVDYIGELRQFADEVIPRLEARGIRQPRPALDQEA